MYDKCGVFPPRGIVQCKHSYIVGPEAHSAPDLLRLLLQNIQQYQSLRNLENLGIAGTSDPLFYIYLQSICLCCGGKVSDKFLHVLVKLGDVKAGLSVDMSSQTRMGFARSASGLELQLIHVE